MDIRKTNKMLLLELFRIIEKMCINNNNIKYRPNYSGKDNLFYNEVLIKLIHFMYNSL